MTAAKAKVTLRPAPELTSAWRTAGCRNSKLRWERSRSRCACVSVHGSVISLRVSYSSTQLVSVCRWGRFWLPDDALPKLDTVARVYIVVSAVGSLRLAAGHSRLIPTFINRIKSTHKPEHHIRASFCLPIMIPRKVDQIKSPAVSTLHRRDEPCHSANRRDEASPRSYKTPPPNGMGRDDYQRYGDRVDKEVDGSIVGERRVLQNSPRQPTCIPPSRETKPCGGEGDEQLFLHSGENSTTPVVGGNKATRSTDGLQRPNGQSAAPVSAAVSSSRPAVASSPAALRRCNSQQPRLLAAAAAIEAAAVAVAAIPKVSNVYRVCCRRAVADAARRR